MANADVDVDAAGNIILNRRGMSVVADWRTLPGYLIPEHLDDGQNGASGKGMRVFAHGAGGFVEEEVAEGLALLHKRGSQVSGNVVPVASVPVAQFQNALRATRPHWIDDES